MDKIGLTLGIATAGIASIALAQQFYPAAPTNLNGNVTVNGAVSATSIQTGPSGCTTSADVGKIYRGTRSYGICWAPLSVAMIVTSSLVSPGF